MSHDRAGTIKEFTFQFLRRQLVTEEFVAVDNVIFEVRRGEVFSLIGPNGAGKTTLMKVVARVLPPSKGRVIVRKCRIEILDKIYFETDSAVVKPISYPILNAIAATLTRSP